MRYDKLVRDLIPERIRSKGEKAVTHIADDAEYWGKLREKLGEEVAEFSKDSNIEELADIYEVLDAIVAHKNFDPKEIARVKAKKAGERGGFSKRIILEEA